MPGIDEKQFLSLYDQHVGKIYRYIFFRVCSEELAQDLTSEVFLKSWQNLSGSSAKKLDNPRAFFYQVARNCVADYYRQKDKSPLSLEEIADAAITDKSEAVSDKTMRELEMEEVMSALTKINQDYREVIVWRYLDEMEIKEISDILKRSEGAVRVLISRALASLKEAIK